MAAPGGGTGARRGPGRDLPRATATGLVLAAVILGALWLYRPLFVVALLVVVAVGLLELVGALRAHGLRPSRLVALGAAVVLVVGAYLYGPAALAFGLLVTLLAVLGRYLADPRRAEVARGAAATLLVVAFVPFLAAHLALVLRADDYLGAIFGYALLTVVYDTAAYATGATLGRHRIAPALSPHKSWEGAAGASAACLLAGALLLPLWAPWSLASGLALAAVACVVAPLGDLSESMLKRDLAVKDMGSLLPGHGGMLDRIDALLFMAPALYYVLALFDRL